MIRPLAKKKIILKNRLHLNVIIAVLLLILVLLLIFPFKNLLSDLYFQGYEKMQKDKKSLDEQIEYLCQSIDVNPDNPEYFDELANLFFKSHETDLTSINSEAALREVNQRSNFINHPHFSKIFKSWSISSNTPIYRLMPISAHLQSTKLNPLNADNYLRLGLLLSSLLSEDKIDVFLRQAVNLEPQNIHFHYAIGSRHLWNQKIKEALNEFQQVLYIASKHKTNIFINMYLPKIMSQSFLLINDVARIKQIIPPSYYCYLKFAQFLSDRNMPIDSKEYFYKAYQTAPKDKREEILISLARQLARFKEWDELIKIVKTYEEIKTDDRNSYQFNILLIQAYYNQGEYEKVIQTADNALSLDPSNPNLHYYKGLSYSRISQNRKAVQAFEKAVEYAPDNIGMRINLANTYQSTGNLASALSQWQTVLKLSSADSNISTQAINNIIRIKSELLRSSKRN